MTFLAQSKTRKLCFLSLYMQQHLFFLRNYNFTETNPVETQNMHETQWQGFQSNSERENENVAKGEKLF